MRYVGHEGLTVTKLLGFGQLVGIPWLCAEGVGYSTEVGISFSLCFDMGVLLRRPQKEDHGSSPQTRTRGGLFMGLRYRHERLHAACQPADIHLTRRIGIWGVAGFEFSQSPFTGWLAILYICGFLLLTISYFYRCRT